MSRSPEDGVLGRWSRLKREREAEEAPVAAVAPEDTTAEAPVERTDEEILEELGLPAPEELQPGDDFSAFMARAVPEHLRRRALRRLWTSNPVLANLDELLDYGDDFTDAAMVVENLQTTWQVGRGFRDLVIEEPEPVEAGEDEEAALAETDAEAEQAAEEITVEQSEPAIESAEADIVSPSPAAADAMADTMPVQEEIAVAPARRRIRFR